MPLTLRDFWEHHYGKVSLFWSLLTVVGIAITQGVVVSLHGLFDTLMNTFLPFICLLLALFTVTGGIKFHGTFSGSPLVNTSIMLIGALLSNIIGTTGAAVLLIRPLLQANAWRMKKVHTIIFFIFIVGNIGGSLTPLGNPPLLMGLINKVDFFWATTKLLLPTAFTVAVVLALYYLLDAYLYRNEPRHELLKLKKVPFSVEGAQNLAFVPLIVGAAFASSFDFGKAFTVLHVDVSVSLLVEVIALLGITVLSMKLTSRETRKRNGFTWGPITEVAKLFAGIFITMEPLVAMLKAGADGPMGFIIRSLSDSAGNPVNAMYFWFSGLFSGFLDSAPAYIVFFNAASSAAQNPALYMMTTAEQTLVAITMGASFMGALSYIGNAPNMMIKAIAEESGVRMPSFFGYCLWAFAVLTPVFLLVMKIFIS
jgi:Na+/H+ antiporter NhaD/arsenite permease-like protein